MSYVAMLRHSITILEPPAELPDGWGDKPVFTDGLTVRGLVQERTGAAVDGPDLGGQVVSDAKIFLERTAVVTEQNRLRRNDSGLVYRIVYVNDAAGQGHHLETDCRRVTPVAAEAS